MRLPPRRPPTPRGLGDEALSRARRSFRDSWRRTARAGARLVWLLRQHPTPRRPGCASCRCSRRPRPLADGLFPTTLQPRRRPSGPPRSRSVGRRYARVSYGGGVARALITNDDGIDSPGLWALAVAARDAGLEVVVAAPHGIPAGSGRPCSRCRTTAGQRCMPASCRGCPGWRPGRCRATPRTSCTRPAAGGSTRRPTSSCPGSTSAPTWATPCCIPARSGRP